jgi:RHS repeat-associated protein
LALRGVCEACRQISNLKELEIYMTKLILILTAFAVGLAGQTANFEKTIKDGRTPLVLEPGTPTGSYALSSFESVNLYSGSVNIQVPLARIGGRGESGYQITVPIRQLKWSIQKSTSTTRVSENGSFEYSHAAGASPEDWSFYRAYYGPGMLVSKRMGEGQLPCNNGASFAMSRTFTHFVFHSPDGSEIPLYSRLFSGSADGQNCSSSGMARGQVFESRGGSKLVFVGDVAVFENTDAGAYSSGSSANPLEANGKLYFPNGSYYKIRNGLVDAIVDRNGNRTTFTYKSVSGGGALLGSIFAEFATDPLGRRTSFTYGARPAKPIPVGCTPYSDQILYPGYQSLSPRTVTVRYTQLKCATRSDSSLPSSARFPVSEISNADDEDVVSEIILPNGRAWRFFYNRYGEIAKVDLPTGAAVEYDFGAGLNPGSSTAVHPSGMILSSYPSPYTGNVGAGQQIPEPGWVPSIHRRLQARRTYASATGGSQKAAANTEDSNTTYPNFESGGTDVVSPQFPGKVMDVPISSSNEVQVLRTDRISGQTVTEIHKFHGETNDATMLSAFSPAKSILLSASATSSLKTLPFNFEGKEFFTSIGGLKSSSVYWTTVSNGTEVKPCVENTKLLDSPLLEANRPVISKFYLYDTNGSGLALNATESVGSETISPRQGNQTEAFDYPFSTPISVTTESAPGGTRYLCPSSAPAGFIRKSVKKYMTGDYLAVGATPTFDPLFIGQFQPAMVYEESVQNSAGTVMSKVNFVYDGSGGAPRATRRADYCSGQTRKRGNITTVQRMLKGLGAISDAERTVNETLGYDCLGNLIGYVDAKGKQTDFSYDDMFIGVNPTDPDHPSSVSFSSFAFLTKTQMPAVGSPAERHEISRKYDLGSGRPVEETDRTGVKRSFAYADPLDRLTSIQRSHPSDPLLAQSSDFTYNDIPSGAVAGTIETAQTQYSAAESTKRLLSRIEFDGWGQTTKSMSGRSDSVSSTKTYDGFQRLRIECNPSSASSTTTNGCRTMNYDALDRILNVTNPDNSQVKSSYAGEKTTAEDEAGNKTERTVDALGRLMQVVEAPGLLNYLTTYTFDELDNLRTVAQAGAPRRFEYDSWKRLREAENPESGVTKYSYDDNGNLLLREDALTKKTCSGSFTSGNCTDGFDALNRLTRKTYSDQTPYILYCYDGQTASDTGCTGSAIPASRGRLTGIGNYTPATGALVSRTNYGFDAAGRVLSSEQKDGTLATQSAQYSYYTDDSLAATIYPGAQRTVTNCYDGLGRIKWVSQVGTTTNCIADQTPVNFYAIVNEYFPHGATKQLTLGNGLVENHGANNRLQWTSVAVGALLSATLSFGAQNNGNPATQVIARNVNGQSFSATQSYIYDPVNRLKTASEGASWNQTYVYDARGNRAVLGTSTIPSPARTPQVASDSASLVESQFVKNRWAEGAGGQTYDLAGNQTVELGGRTFQYDAENRLIQSSLPAGSSTIVTTFVYDGNGRRIKKTVGAAETRYIYDAAGNLLLELASGISGSPTTNTSYLTQDWLGSTRMVTSELGQVKECIDFFPFGEEVGSALGARPSCYQGVVNPSLTAAGRTEQRFTSKERDAETGLDYFGARFFSSAQGRYITPDWSETPQPIPYADISTPQTLNLYAYVGNQPLSHVDLDGHCGTNVACWGQLSKPIIQKADVVRVATATAIVGAFSFVNDRLNTPGAVLGGWPNAGVVMMQQSQGRDDQGKFLDKNPGEAQPGKIEESEALA